MGRTFRNKDRAQTERLKNNKRNRVKSRRVIIEPCQRDERPRFTKSDRTTDTRPDREWNGDW